MFGRLARKRPTPALIVGVIALIAATSGAAIALPGTNSVDSGDIKNGQVKTVDLANNAVRSAKVANGSLLSADFAAGQIPAGPTGPVGPTGHTGETGVTGPAGLGVTGPAGLIEVRQAHEETTAVAITAATFGTRQVIGQLTLPGPASYLIEAEGALDATGMAAETGLNLDIGLQRDGTIVGAGQRFGIAELNTGLVYTSYHVLRLINVPDASDLVQVWGYKVSGVGAPSIYGNTLTATLVNTAIGAQ